MQGFETIKCKNFEKGNKRKFIIPYRHRRSTQTKRCFELVFFREIPKNKKWPVAFSKHWRCATSAVCFQKTKVKFGHIKAINVTLLCGKPQLEEL